jgi:hypothetical protein
MNFEVGRIDLTEPFFEIYNEAILRVLKVKQKEMKINDFQIEKMKIYSIMIKDKKSDLLVEISDKKLVLLNKLKENHTLETIFHIELVPFGKKDFHFQFQEGHKVEKFPRFFDHGNIFFLIKGKIK